MSKQLKVHGNPEGVVFGILNASLDTDENKTYSKARYDTLNIGWENVTSPTPFVTPTPTPTPNPLDEFSCAEIQVTGSAKCGNPVGVFWSLAISASVSSSINWTVPASPENPVNIFGTGGTAESLMSGEIKYVKKENLGAGVRYELRFNRNTSSIDDVKIKTYIHSGSNFLSVGGVSYVSKSFDATIKVRSITGSYKYHTRENGTADAWSDARYFDTQIMQRSNPETASIFIGEVVGASSYFNFPIEIAEQCPPELNTYCQRLWIDYDYLGRIKASWLDCDTGNLISVDESNKTPYTLAITACHRVDTLSRPYGSNNRFAECDEPDPRGDSFLIDAQYNADGQVNFHYIDPFGTTVYFEQDGAPWGWVYGIACGKEVTLVNIGTAYLSARHC